jgi:hypothetical protein
MVGVHAYMHVRLHGEGATLDATAVRPRWVLFSTELMLKAYFDYPTMPPSSLRIFMSIPVSASTVPTGQIIVQNSRSFSWIPECPAS